MEPMKMKPAFKDYLWGGEALVTRYGKDTDMKPVAESWELSCHPDGPSYVENGEFAGLTLPQALARRPEMAGKHTGEFPVLIKLIDAKQSLSLQVHPDDDYAKRMENQLGKNEMWYVIDCEPGAELILGFKESISKEDFRESIIANTIMEKVRRVPVKPGDCFCIPAGMLHAIGAGLLIAEIQQSSNVTYRIYDYNRVGADGKPRELHIDSAVEVTDSSLTAENCAEKEPVRHDGYSAIRLTGWKYFTADLLTVSSKAEISCGKDTFQCLLVTSGELEIEYSGSGVTLAQGETAFIPAGFGDYVLRGKGTALLTTA